MIEILPGISVNIFLLVSLGLGVGVLSGFAGVGGGFFMTPALIVIGVPANFAVGTSLVWVMGNSIVGVFRHHKLGNVNMKLGLFIIIGAIIGTELGVRIIDRVKSTGLTDEVVLFVSIVILLTIGTFTLIEAIQRKKQIDAMIDKGETNIPAAKAIGISQKLHLLHVPPMLHFGSVGVTISLWVILAIGFFVGILAGIIGVGGGIVITPALVYFVGCSSFAAVGTGLFSIMLSSAYGSVRHTMSGNVLIFTAFILLLASFAGVYFGATVTRYVRGVTVRYITAITFLLCAAGATLQGIDLLLDQGLPQLHTASIGVIFGSLGLMVIIIVSLFFMASHHRRGQSIPTWSKSLLN